MNKRKGACCISPSRGITLISITSGVNGSCITLVTLLAIYHKTSPLHSEQSCSLLNMLLFIGISSFLSSFYVLCSKGTRTSVKIWIISHLMTILAILKLFRDLLTKDYEISDLLYGLFSFIGLYFCQIVFCTLIMVDFLTRSDISMDDLDLDDAVHNSFFNDSQQDLTKIYSPRGNSHGLTIV